MAKKTGRVRPGTSPATSVHADATGAIQAPPVDYAGIAILVLDDPRVPSTMSFAREVAIAFPAGRPTLSWLVHMNDPAVPPVRVTSPSGSLTGQDVTGGRGLPVALVARELAAAVTGYRVMTPDPPRICGWLQRLFDHADEGLAPFQVEDLYQHFEDLRSLPAEDRDAFQAATRMVGAGERAASEAARNAAYTAALSIRVRVRLREMSADRKADPGVTGP
jgi:hypothetical protein